MAAGSTFLPRVFPVSIGYVLYLRNQDINPHTIVFASVMGAFLGDMMLRWIGGYVIQAVQWTYNKFRRLCGYTIDTPTETASNKGGHKESSKGHTPTKTRLYEKEVPNHTLPKTAIRARTVRQIHKVVRRSYLVLNNPHNASALFVAIGVTAYLAIPDLVIVSLVRKHQTMRFYLIAATIGKFVLYAGYVYALER